MKKILGMAAVLVFLTATVVSNAYAQLNLSQSTCTATVTFDASAGTFTWNVSLKNVGTGTNAQQILWSTNSITIGTTRWADASVYAVLTSTLTRGDRKIQLYTRNHQNTNNYLFVGSTLASAGLVKQVAGNAGSNITLPFAFRIFDSTVTVNANQGAASVKVHPYSAIPTPNGYYDGGMYMTDAYAGDFNTDANKMAYRTILSQAGFRYGGDPSEMGGAPTGTFYIYFGADFGKAMGGSTYGTNTVTFHGMTE